jgi:hypothetical protein
MDHPSRDCSLHKINSGSKKSWNSLEYFECQYALKNMKTVGHISALKSYKYYFLHSNRFYANVVLTCLTSGTDFLTYVEIFLSKIIFFWLKYIYILVRVFWDRETSEWNRTVTVIIHTFQNSFGKVEVSFRVVHQLVFHQLRAVFGLSAVWDGKMNDEKERLCSNFPP